LVAALPLVRSRRWGTRMARTLGNAWTPGGELLLDRECDLEAMCRLLLLRLHQSAPGLVELDGLMLDSIGCRSLLATAHAERMPNLTRRRFQVPLVEVRGDWQGYLAARSKNHRHQLRNIARRGNERGGVTFERHEAIAPADVEPLLRECFELEAAGWKGRVGGAVLNDPTAWRFFVCQAQRLAETWQLAIAVLRHEGRLVAFEYGWQTRGVRGVLKIGYDETYARLSPGQLLRANLLEQLFAAHSVGWIDFLGPARAATGVWATHQYEVGRTLLSQRSVGARLAFEGARLWQNRKALVSSCEDACDREQTPWNSRPPNVPSPCRELPEPVTTAACDSTERRAT
jgi:CelD/BcsL family acetyltransferase involved in cellulose biosynthesis